MKLIPFGGGVEGGSKQGVHRKVWKGERGEGTKGEREGVLA